MLTCPSNGKIFVYPVHVDLLTPDRFEIGPYFWWLSYVKNGVEDELRPRLKKEVKGRSSLEEILAYSKTYKNTSGVKDEDKEDLILIRITGQQYIDLLFADLP